MARNRGDQKNTTRGHTLTCGFFPKFWRLNSGAFFEQGLKLVRGCFFGAWARRGLCGRKHCKNRYLGSKQGLQRNGPEKHSRRKLTSGPRHLVQWTAFREEKNQKWGHLLTLGVVRSVASLISNFQKSTRNTWGKWGHLKNCSGAMRKRVPHINLWKCKNVVPELAWQRKNRTKNSHQNSHTPRQKLRDKNLHNKIRTKFAAKILGKPPRHYLTVILQKVTRGAPFSLPRVSPKNDKTETKNLLRDFGGRLTATSWTTNFGKFGCTKIWVTLRARVKSSNVGKLSRFSTKFSKPPLAPHPVPGRSRNPDVVESNSCGHLDFA